LGKVGAGCRISSENREGRNNRRSIYWNRRAVRASAGSPKGKEGIETKKIAACSRIAQRKGEGTGRGNRRDHRIREKRIADRVNQSGGRGLVEGVKTGEDEQKGRKE